MLIELFGRNFGCFRDEFHLSMLPADIDPGNPRGIVETPLKDEKEPLRLLRCVALYGPNASGKSTILRAAPTLRFLIRESIGFGSDDPLHVFEPFILDEASRNKPTMLGLRAAVDGAVYEYAIEFDQTEFVSERLTQLTADSERVLIDRHFQEVEGEWREDNLFRLLVEAFRPNVLLLSLADRVAPRLAGRLAAALAKLLIHHDYGGASLNLSTIAPNLARRLREDAEFGDWVRSWLRSADFGVISYEVKELKDKIFGIITEGDAYHSWSEPMYELNLTHGARRVPVTISYSKESMATRKIVELAPFIYDLTKSYDHLAYFIDEMGASVHPHLLQAIIQYFNGDVKAEDVRGQLIFTAHETLLFEAKDAVLRRDQVYFTEKDVMGESRLYSLAEFKERNNLNFRRRYLQGRYGALPLLGRFGGGEACGNAGSERTGNRLKVYPFAPGPVLRR